MSHLVRWYLCRGPLDVRLDCELDPKLSTYPQAVRLFLPIPGSPGPFSYRIS